MDTSVGLHYKVTGYIAVSVKSVCLVAGRLGFHSRWGHIVFAASRQAFGTTGSAKG